MTHRCGVNAMPRIVGLRGNCGLPRITEALHFVNELEKYLSR